jgi:alpha-glucosidase
MLNTSNYVRTTWNRDAFLVPSGTNLYGDHPVYFDHRNENGTHGVFLLNSNGSFTSKPAFAMESTPADNLCFR